jgi:hypothetical protein
MLSNALSSAPLLLALLICALAACRSAPPPERAPQPPGVPTDGLRGAANVPEAGIAETRRMEEELESPVAADEAPPVEELPGTVVVGFGEGDAALGRGSRALLDDLISRLRAARVAYPIELVADAGGGSDRKLQRRRLEAVHAYLRDAGLAASELLQVPEPAELAGGSDVFVVVRQH